MLKKLELGSYGKHDRVSYLFNSDRQLRAIREEFTAYWRHLPDGEFLLGSIPVQGGLAGLTLHLVPQFFPVIIKDDRRVLTLGREILAIETVGRVRFQD